MSPAVCPVATTGSLRSGCNAMLQHQRHAQHWLQTPHFTDKYLNTASTYPFVYDETEKRKVPLHCGPNRNFTFLVCVVDADTLMLGRVIYYIFPSSSYSTFHLIMCPPLLSSLKTSAIDFKLYYSVQTGLNSRSNIFLEIWPKIKNTEPLEIWARYAVCERHWTALLQTL